ncbi:basic leucine zipper 19-like [Rutidosis leptorrhynchoides]|uniref:basic leucine zipper 19-like n=1 Tax=Rutidosis leptorrhynchoides TaxID=125765 RepID=UPI003A991CCE
MEDGELDFSNHEMFTDANMVDMPNNDSIDSFFDDIFKDTHACTHTHTCNPPGPDSSHTHTCYHVHTKIVPTVTGDDDKTPTDDNAESEEKNGKRRPLGNREAVRKYREKKKARAASLEDEVVRLRALNQQLMKRIQSQAGLEAEVARLKCLLVDIRGRIEGEIGSFPYQKQPTANQNIVNASMTGGYVMNPCNMQCGDQVYCLHPNVDGKTGEGASILDPAPLNGCEFENLHCMGTQNALLNGFPGCTSSTGFAEASSAVGRTKRRGSRAAVTE